MYCLSSLGRSWNAADHLYAFLLENDKIQNASDH